MGTYNGQIENSWEQHGWIRHELYKDMIHVFFAMAWLPSAKLAMLNIKRFLKELEMKEVDVGKTSEDVSHHNTNFGLDDPVAHLQEEKSLCEYNLFMDMV